MFSRRQIVLLFAASAFAGTTRRVMATEAHMDENGTCHITTNGGRQIDLDQSMVNNLKSNPDAVASAYGAELNPVQRQTLKAMPGSPKGACRVIPGMLARLFPGL